MGAGDLSRAENERTVDGVHTSRMKSRAMIGGAA